MITEQQIMITLIFGTSALVIGIYYFVVSYMSGFKEVYGYGQSKTIYEVVAGTLMMHIALVTVAVLFLNTFEVISGFDLYGGIAKILKTDWFGMVRGMSTGSENIKTVGVLLGYIKLITVLFLALAPVVIFFGIVIKQYSECVRSNKQGNSNKGSLTCAYEIVAPAILFLTVYFIHLTFASVLIGGGDFANPNHDFLRQIGIHWWQQVITLH